jgi:hypothetical protein
MIKWSETAMKKKTIALFFALMITASGTGCQAIKRIFIKPPPEGVIQESYTIRLMGYKQTVTIKGSPEELSEFLNDPEKSSTAMLSGIAIKGAEEPSEAVEPTHAGTSFSLKVNLMGFEIPGQLIVLKVIEHKLLWIVWDNPYVFQIQRWESTPVKEGTRLTFKFDTEIPREGILGNLVDALGFMGLADVALKEVDLMLAMIQAHFDPSLNPRELVAVGLRGEPYETFLQADEASIWVNAGPEEVAEYIVTNLESYLPEMKREEECNLEEFINMQKGQIIHCPAAFKFLSLDLDLDTFFTWIEKGKNHVFRVYAPGRDNLVFVDFSVTPEAGGSRVKAVVVNEIPGPTSQRLVDIMMALAAVPKRISEFLVDIKQGVEGTG